MQFPKDHVRDAIDACGSNTQRCIDYCLARSKDSGTQPISDSDMQAEKENAAAETFCRLGYSAETATKALELCDFSFIRALQYLLYGSDLARTRYLSNTRFKRHTRKQIARLPKALASDAVRA